MVTVNNKIPTTRPQYERPPVIEVAAVVDFEPIDPKILAIFINGYKRNDRKNATKNMLNK